jgi:hypothetical protein
MTIKKTKKIVFVVLYILNSTVGLTQINDVNLKITGLSEEFANKFRNNKREIIDQLNHIDLPKSIAPVSVDVSYKNGEGWVTMSINYKKEDIFSLTKYSSHNASLKGMGNGISFLFVDDLMTVLSVYKFDVAKDGLLINKDLSKFKSCIKLINGNNYVQVYAWNYLGDPYSGEGVYPLLFYKNITVFFDGKKYDTETSNLTALNEMKFFYKSNDVDLSGTKSGSYYFGKFFELPSDNELKQKEIASENAYNKKKDEITSKEYNLKEIAPDKYQDVYNTLQKELLQCLVEEYYHKSYSHIIPFFKEMNDLHNYHLQNIYSAKFHREGDSYYKDYKAEYTFLEGTDTKCNALYTAWWYRYFPLINKDGFDVSINFTVDSVKIDFYKGIVKVKVKKNDVEFISESPAADIKEKIINNIISKEKGIYFVGYEYGEIMGKKISNFKAVTNMFEFYK